MSQGSITNVTTKDVVACRCPRARPSSGRRRCQRTWPSTRCTRTSRVVRFEPRILDHTSRAAGCAQAESRCHHGGILTSCRCKLTAPFFILGCRIWQDAEMPKYLDWHAGQDPAYYLLPLDERFGSRFDLQPGGGGRGERLGLYALLLSAHAVARRVGAAGAGAGARPGHPAR
jgi:hypothetical protein